MKKFVLFFLSLMVCATTFAANLNPYAYNLKKISYDDNSKTLVIGYSLNAPADSIFVYAEDAGGRKYQLCHIGARGAGDHTESLQLLYADDVDILPRNEQLTWGVAAKGKKYSTHQTCGRKIDSHTPFSISIDRNPNSDYFGRIITAQTNNNYSVGLYAYDAGFRGGYYCLDPDVYLGNKQNWYDNTFLTPYRVRIIQDGSGRVLVSSAAVGQPVYLWALQNPNDLNDWTPLIYSHIMKEYAPVGLNNPKDDSMGNIDFDLKIDGDKLDILLFGSSLTGTTKELVLTEKDKALHSGIYSCNLSDLQGGNYRALTEDDRKGGNPHPLVTNSNYCSLASAQTAYDKYGGVWFCGYNTTAVGFADYPSLYHLINGNSALSQSYSNDSYLLRKNVGSAAICYNKTFDRFAISQGNLANEARIYNVSQAEGAHPVLSNGSSVSMTDISGTKLIADMCWDYADNLYLCVRNRDAALQGVWVIAAALNGDTTSTPAPINKGNEFTMTCRDVQHRVTATSSISMSCKIQNADGTDFVDGLYDECSKITLKAVPSAGYKFLGWKKDGNLVSAESTYSFYVSQPTDIMAMFEYAVYNVEWYNLFEEGKDITTIGVDNNDNKINNRLWYLFMPMFNEYCGTSISNPGTVTQTGDVKNAFHVLKFLDGQQTNTTKFMTNENSPFYWLGMYIKAALGANETIANNTYEWPYLLHLFFNRTNQCYNINGDNVSNLSDIKKYFYNNTIPDFRTKGHPNYWRKYWTRYACNLPMELSYDQSLPTEWAKIAKPSTYVTYEPTWYKWNNVWSPPYNGNNHTHILAWRFGSATGEIVNHVPSPEPGQESVKLYATYIKKHIHENDPDLDSNDICDAKNSDVLKLLFNDHWDGARHKITVTRKLQAGMYNTICLPFNVNLKTDLPADGSLDGAEFWQYDGTVSSTYNQSGEPVSVLNFTRVTDRLVAGTPYLVEVKKNVTNDLFFSGALEYDGKSVLCDTTLRPVIADPEAEVKINFIGTINPTTIPDGALILVANNRLAMSTGGRMNGMRGYFVMDISDPIAAAELAEQAADGRVYLSMKKPATTSIPVAPEAEQQAKPEVRKVMYDGKIYILRGEDVYTITGNRVR